MARPNFRRVAHRAEHHFGFGRRRHDVRARRRRRSARRCSACGRAPDRHGSSIDRSSTSASSSLSMADSPSSGNDECAARPVARSLRRRTPRVASPEPVVGRLAVDQKPAAVRPRGSPRARRRCRAPRRPRTAGRRASRPRAAGHRPPPPAPPECPSRRTPRGRRSDRPRCGSERTAARNRSAWRSTTDRAVRRRRDDVEAGRRRPAAR